MEISWASSKNVKQLLYSNVYKWLINPLIVPWKNIWLQVVLKFKHTWISKPCCINVSNKKSIEKNMWIVIFIIIKWSKWNSFILLIVVINEYLFAMVGWCKGRCSHLKHWYFSDRMYFGCTLDAFKSLWSRNFLFNVAMVSNFVYQQEILNHFAQACIDGTLTLENLSSFHNHFTSFEVLIRNLFQYIHLQIKLQIQLLDWKFTHS